MKNPEDRNGYLFSKGYSNYVFILLFLLYMFDYIDRTVVTSMFTSIERDWGISHTQSGMLMSAVYWAIVILTFPVSILVDRWSRTKTIGIMAIMWSLATALCALTGNYVQLFMARLMIGVGEAGYAPGGSAMISGLYPIEKRSRMMGIWNASIPLGTAIGVLLGGIIAVKLGWKHAFGMVALPGLIVAILFLFVKDYKTVDLSFIDKTNKKIKMEKKDMVKEFISKPSVIYTYFGMAAVVFVTTSLITWLSTYFADKREIFPRKQQAQWQVPLWYLLLSVLLLEDILTDRWRKTQIMPDYCFRLFHHLFQRSCSFRHCTFLKAPFSILFFWYMGISIMVFISGACCSNPGCNSSGSESNILCNCCCGSEPSWCINCTYSDRARYMICQIFRQLCQYLPFVLMVGAVLF